MILLLAGTVLVKHLQTVEQLLTYCFDREIYLTPQAVVIGKNETIYVTLDKCKYGEKDS